MVDNYGDRGGKGKYDGGGKGKFDGGKGKFGGGKGKGKGRKGPPNRPAISQDEIEKINYSTDKPMDGRRAEVIKIPPKMSDSADEDKPAIKTDRNYATRPGAISSLCIFVFSVASQPF